MKIAFKELLFYKKKYLLVESLVILMIFMVMFLSGLTNGLGRFVSAGIEELPINHIILQEEADGIVSFSSLSEENLTAIDGLKLKNQEELLISRNQVTADSSEDSLDMTYFVLQEDSSYMPILIEGDKLAKDMDIILDNRFMADGIKVGDTIVDKKSELEFKVVGFTSGAMYGHTGIGYMTQETYTKLAQKTNPKYTWAPQAILTADDLTDAKGLDSLSFVTKAELIEKIPGYAAEQGTLSMITWVLVVASAVILAVFFYIISLEKRQQFGVMKALGMGMGKISYQQLSQVTLLAVFGAVIGDALALGMASVLPVKMPFYLNLTDVVKLSLVFILVTLLASLLSVSRIAKVDPLMIINGGEA